MPDTFSYPQRAKNPEDTGQKVAIGVGIALAIAAAYWLTMGEAKAATGTTPPPPPPPPTPEPGPDELYVSPDCKVVKRGATWIENWAVPRINEAVYAGRGLPLLSNTPGVLNNSLNAVVRDMLQPWTDCAVKLPWADWYVADQPVPVPQQGQNRAQFYQLMDNHRDAFVAQLATSLEQFPQLNGLVQDLGNVNMNVFLDRYHYVPGYVGIEEAPYTESGMSTSQNNMLRSMGYNINANVVELFQSEFNTVMDAWVGDWYTTSKDIPVDNKLDNQTDDALKFAYRSSTKSGVPWVAMVAQSMGAGPNGEPPKDAPNA